MEFSIKVESLAQLARKGSKITLNSHLGLLNEERTLYCSPKYSKNDGLVVAGIVVA